MNVVRIGLLTPSSNTVLEPVSAAMLAGLPEASAYFSRFRVTEIAPDARTFGHSTTARSCVRPARRVRGWGRLFEIEDAR